MAARGGSRLGLYGALAAAGGAGYYFYSKGEIPSKEPEQKTSAKALGEEAGQKVDNAIADAKATTSKIDEKLEAYRAQADKKIGEVSSQTAKDLHSAVDKFDKTVEEKTAQSKSWLSGWFK